MRDFYAFLLDEIPALLDRWHQQVGAPFLIVWCPCEVAMPARQPGSTERQVADNHSGRLSSRQIWTDSARVFTVKVPSDATRRPATFTSQKPSTRLAYYPKQPENSRQLSKF
jgi:hypothetical protein